MWKVVQLRSMYERDVEVVIADDFGTLSDALDYCEEHDPDSSLGYRVERMTASERVRALRLATL